MRWYANIFWTIVEIVSLVGVTNGESRLDFNLKPTDTNSYALEMAVTTV